MLGNDNIRNIAETRGSLPIPFVEDEQIFPIASHGGSGSGKSTLEVDILLWALENKIVSGIASNIEIGLRGTDGVRRFDAYTPIRYLTEIPTLRNVALGLDELNRSLDGRDWRDSIRKISQKLVDNSRRYGIKILVATSIRMTGIDLGLRNSIRAVIEPTGVKTNSGYPIYQWFDNYPAYEKYLTDPERNAHFVYYHGFHTVDYLKTMFDSKREPKLDAYPPIQDYGVVAHQFLEWGKSVIWNQRQKLVNQSELLLHIGHWNREVHSDSIAYSESDVKSIASTVLGMWNSGKLVFAEE